MKKPTKEEMIIANQKSIISAQSDCLIELVQIANEYADLVGVEEFCLEPCFGQSGRCCWLEAPAGYTGSLADTEAERAIMAFRGMSAQATTN